MSGYGTAKFETNALNLGFPTAFAKDYARFGSPEMFAPERPISGLDNTVGNDFQAQWHEQKKRDADYMANAKVRSTHNMNARAFSSPHGYYNLPPPVLGQRRFANASMGSIYSHSTRDDQPSNNAPFHLREDSHSSFPSVPRAKVTEELIGGVLRTSAGQRHGKKALDERIGQLNAINEAKMTFLSDGNSGRSNTITPFAGAQGTLDTALTSAPLVELANLLQSIKNSLSATGGRDVSFREVLQDSTKAFALMVRMAVNNTASDIANVLEFIEGTSAGDGIGQMLEYQQEQMEGGVDGDDDVFYVARLTQQIEWWGNCVRYLKKMIEVSELPPQARLQTSNALIKSLGFAKLVRNSEQTYKTGVVRDDDFIDSTGYVNNPQNLQRAQDLQARAGRSGAFINPGPRLPGSRRPDNPYASVFAPRPPRGRDYDSETFSTQAPRREDTQHGYFGEGGARFSASAQEPYAYGSGEFLDRSGGRPRAWAGEEALAEYGEAPPDEDAIIEARQQAGLEGVEDGDEDLGDGEDAEGAFPAPPPALALASRRDPETGEYNVVAPPRPGASSASSAPRGRAEPKPYKESDVPRTIPELRQFIQMLHDRHGYNQAIYKKAGADPKPRSVRVNTIAKMKSAGLL